MSARASGKLLVLPPSIRAFAATVRVENVVVLPSPSWGGAQQLPAARDLTQLTVHKEAMPGAGTDKTETGSRWRGRSSSWSSRNSARTSARPRARWPISGCRNCGSVAPRQAWPNPKARMMAAGADRVLEAAQLYDSLDAAIADCTFVLATTARAHDQAKPVVSPEGGGARAQAPHCGGRDGRDRVRARAHRPHERRGRGGGPHRHLSGQPGLRLAQPRAGGGDHELRVVQARRPRAPFPSTC